MEEAKWKRRGNTVVDTRYSKGYGDVATRGRWTTRMGMRGNGEERRVEKGGKVELEGDNTSHGMWM